MDEEIEKKETERWREGKKEKWIRERKKRRKEWQEIMRIYRRSLVAQW